MSNFLDYCSDLPTRTVRAGETALEENVKDGEILILKSGAVDIVKHGTTMSTISNPGAMLGEIAVLLERGHTASAIATQDCEFYVLEHAGQRLDANPKLYREIARALAGRLMRQSEKNVALQDQLEAYCEKSELSRRWRRCGASIEPRGCPILSHLSSRPARRARPHPARRPLPRNSRCPRHRRR